MKGGQIDPPSPGKTTFKKSGLIRAQKEPYEHKKIENPYVPAALQDAETIEKETKNEIDDCLKAVSESNKVDAPATKQKRRFL